MRPPGPELYKCSCNERGVLPHSRDQSLCFHSRFWSPPPSQDLRPHHHGDLPTNSVVSLPLIASLSSTVIHSPAFPIWERCHPRRGSTWPQGTEIEWIQLNSCLGKTHQPLTPSPFSSRQTHKHRQIREAAQIVILTSPSTPK